MRWPILFFVMTGVFLSTLDSGMINVALPTITRSLKLDLEQSEIIVTVYLLTITATLVFWGMIGDRVGRRNIYIGGMGIFGVGAFCCFVSTTFSFLVFSRFFQAIGASMMMSSGPAILKETFPPNYLGRSLGLVGIATACGLLSGPYVSGQLLLVYGWRAVFLVSMAIAALVFGVGVLVMYRRLPGAKAGSVNGCDWLGGVLWAAVAVVLISLFNKAGERIGPGVVILAGMVVLLGSLFVIRQQRCVNPIVPPEIFSSRKYWPAVVSAAVSFAVLFSVLILMPFYLEYLLQVPVDTVGKMMMAVPATLMVLSPTAGFVYDKIGARIPTTFGLFISFCAMVLVSRLTDTSSLTEVALILAMLGAGQSIFLSPNSASVLSKVDDSFSGTTAGILATARNFGMVSGATVGATLFASLYAKYSGGKMLTDFNPANRPDFLHAFQTSFLLLAALALFGVVVSLLRR
ncbi:MFS transporter [Desulforhopalus singaporensis]|uniref:Major Facilitator Superfamily protein n=1 Tax=Desulforhopalus singaporensis TaxID=91360 RepID=A0A1H0M864_9BACT|nr:MFS transporter [Desulforhopalus singaporensis]SDO76481.1 Major Facilitator Superfamily protein [Desulforhopalus singaporensis]